MKVVADNKIPFLKGVLEPYAEVLYLPGDAISAADVRDADVLITRTRTLCNRELLEHSRMQFIATATIGFDHLDTDFLREHDIHWRNAPGCNSGAVMQYVVSTLLNLAEQTGRPLRGKTLGVIGVGHVGAKVARAAELLGMRVLRNDPPRIMLESELDLEFVPLEQVLAESDYVSLHVPLERSGAYRTCHMADDAFFRRMKRDAFFINTSRGEVCSSRSLSHALTAGIIGGAVLDVWEHEPGIDTALLEKLNYGTSHIAGYSMDGKANATSMAVRAIADFFEIEPLVNFQVTGLPEPPRPVIEVPDSGDFESLLRAVVNHSYDMRLDAGALHRNPGSFEQLRNNYAFRREFPAGRISGGGEEIRETLGGLGFRLD